MESGPTFWLVLLTVGVAALGIAMAFAQWRNSKRTPAEKVLTEIATRREYEVEDRDHS
ncbi:MULTISPECIES: hypothetical protein [Devosia]|uniref:hypothetical protein n=1 Tax=Devosia TaxID=46913 RepID=UPI00273704F4|nr:hypothetical protein [Devosia sp.]MDP2782731.1 hypothetical protein [Devosia sp.]